MSFIIKGAGAFINTSIAGNIQQIIPSFDPSQLGSKLTMWLDEREQTGSPTITAWGDQSSYGTHDLTNAGYATPYTGLTINGYAAPEFRRSLPSHLETTGWKMNAVISNSAYHAFTVVSLADIQTNDTNGYNNEGLLGGGWYPFSFKNNGGSPQLTAGHFAFGQGFKTLTVNSLPLNTPVLLETWYDGTNIQACIGNGAVGSEAAAVIAPNLSGVDMAMGSGSPPQPISGSVATLIVCNQALDNTERANVRQYLGTKYGVSY